MADNRSNEIKRIPLERALRAVSSRVVETATRAGLDAESLLLDVQFGFEAQGDEVKPIVYLGSTPAGAPVHRLQFTLGLSTTLQESERVRQELAALTGDGMLSDSDEFDEDNLVIDDKPADEIRREPNKVLVDDEKEETPVPRIIVPSNPVLKLRHASEMPPKVAGSRGDDHPAKVTDVEYSFASDERKSSDTDRTKAASSALTSMFVLFDHQLYTQPAARVSGEGGAEKET